MRDILLQCSGLVAIAAALLHGILTETSVFPRVAVEPVRHRTLFRLVWQIPTIAWIAGGVLLIAAPSFGSADARHWIVVTIGCVFAFSALGNASARADNISDGQCWAPWSCWRSPATSCSAVTCTHPQALIYSSSYRGAP